MSAQICISANRLSQLYLIATLIFAFYDYVNSEETEGSSDGSSGNTAGVRVLCLIEHFFALASVFMPFELIFMHVIVKSVTSLKVVSHILPGGSKW